MGYIIAESTIAVPVIVIISNESGWKCPSPCSPSAYAGIWDKTTTIKIIRIDLIKRFT
jgi:hypothetical protein